MQSIPVQLSVRNVGKSFFGKAGEVPVLDNLSFDINERDFVSIIGPSGCGKTTIFNIIAGLLEPDSGSMQYRGEEIESLPRLMGLMRNAAFRFIVFCDDLSFDGDDTSSFDETVDFNIDAKYDACAYSTLTPYPGTLTWYEMKKADRIVSFDWTKYDQGHVVYRPANMSGDELRIGQGHVYERFYSRSSIASRFPLES